MNQLAELKTQTLVPGVAGRMAVADVVQQSMAIQEVIKAVMRQNVHYGVIPGTDKPTLYKAGAEKLCLTFHIADEYRVEDLSTGPDAIRYRVTCTGRHQQTGIEMGSGIGEASTSEEKYRWRRAVCKEEFEATPLNLRRTKYSRGKGGSFYTQEQVRTEPADLANTVLKMAAKRAKMAMVLNVLAASDAFAQDLEDLSEELREHLTADQREGATNTVRAEWLDKIRDAKTLDELSALRKPAVAALHKAKDAEGYTLFAQALQTRGAKLRSTAAQTADAQPKATDTGGPPPVLDDPFVAELTAAEGGAK